VGHARSARSSAMSVVAQLGYTPRGTQLRDTPMVSLSPAKIPAVFQRGTPVPWTPRGSPERPKIGEDALAKGSPTEAKHTVEGASGQGVLAEMVGAGSGSVDSSQRGGSESSRSDSDSPAVFTLSLAPVSTSSPPQGQGLAQWTPAHEPASLPRGGADAPPRSEADLSEISEANEENDVSVHASNASLHGDDDFSRMPMSINGVVLDGMQGLSEDIRKNLGTFVRHMRENQNDIAVQAQSCIFLAKYSAYRESSRAKASKAGAMHTVWFRVFSHHAQHWPKYASVDSFCQPLMVFVRGRCLRSSANSRTAVTRTMQLSTSLLAGASTC
jgi:hypothetical protein